MTAHVAIVGASARAAALSVLRSGRQAVAADLFADVDLQQVCPVSRVSPYPKALFDWLRESSCDGWLYTGALENAPDLVDRLARVRTLFGNPGKVLRRIRNPLLLGQLLERHDLPFPETRESPDGLPCDGSWLVKSYCGSSGSGVAELSAETSANKYYQRQVIGTACSAVFAGPTLLGITRQLVGKDWTGGHRYQYCGSIAPWPLPDPTVRQLRKLGKLLTAEFGLQGLFGVDFVFDGQRPWTIEVNPRYTAAVEVVERAYQANVIDWHLHHCRSELVLPSLPERSSAYHGKAILFARNDSTISTEFTHWALSQTDLADIPHAGAKVLIGQPVLTMFANAKTSEYVLSALKTRALEIESCLKYPSTAIRPVDRSG